MRATAAIAFAVLGLTVAARGGTVLHEWTAAGGDPFFGSAVALLGDVDGDHYDDVVVGDPFGGNFTGSVHVFSGRSGELLLEVFGDVQGEEFGRAVSGAGDVDSDGLPDFAVGVPLESDRAPGAGRVNIYSGADGSLIRELDGIGMDTHFGAALCLLGDIDGDTYPELVVGAPRETDERRGAVRVYSGRSGNLLHHLVGDAVDDFLGTSVAAADDVDGDGVPDLVAGAPQSPDRNGYARLFSGADGAVLRQFDGDSEADALGAAVGGAGDVDSDGVPDVIVGAPGLDVSETDSGGVLVYSGADGTPIHVFTGDREQLFLGLSVAGVGDMDGDGVCDVAAGTDKLFDGYARVYSGATGNVVVTVDGFREDQEGLGSGIIVSPGGDVNDDGIPDMLVGVPTRIVSIDPGRVMAVTGIELPWISLGGSLGGTGPAPYLDGVGLLQPATTYALRLLDAPPSSAARLVIGLTVANLPFKGGLLVPWPHLIDASLTTDADGGLHQDLFWPPGVPSGTTLTYQIWVDDPGAVAGMVASNAVQGVAP